MSWVGAVAGPESALATTAHVLEALEYAHSQTNDGFEIKRDSENHPVTLVNWDNAQAFCKLLTEKEGKTYRLPTDRK